VLIVAHGSTARALVKHLDRISDADIMGLNVPTGFFQFQFIYFCLIVSGRDMVFVTVLLCVLSICLIC